MAADQYITAAYIRAHLGTAYVTAVEALTGVSETTLIEGSTALIQSAMRNSGYAVAATTTATGIEPIVMLATLGAFREALASIPEGSIPLPSGWESNPQKVAYQGILDGSIQLAAEPTQAGAVGSMIFTSSDPDVEGSVPLKTSRDELSGF